MAISVECKSREAGSSYILTTEVLDKHRVECLGKGNIPVWVLGVGAHPPIAAMLLQDLGDMLTELRLRRK